MRQLIALLVLLGFAVSSTTFAAEEAKKPSSTKTTAGTRSLDPAKGRFHQVHTKKQKMACTNCHSTEVKDALFLRRDEALPAGMPGQVDRSLCLGCHQEPAKPTWYGSAAR